MCIAPCLPRAGGKATIALHPSQEQIRQVYNSQKIKDAGGKMSRRIERNKRIKKQVIKLNEEGYSLKEALNLVADRWYLSAKQVERIYYETRME
jgi:hypothetical protein